MTKRKRTRSFRLLTYFVVTSLVTILAVGTLVTLSYRQVAITSITELGEDINLTVAQIALHSIKPELLAYLEQVADADPDALRAAEVPAALRSGVNNLLRETAVIRIKIYNRLGVVVYSTRSEQIGRVQNDNEGFRTAMGGDVASRLIYRDRFNIFDKETSEDNLIQSYVPVRDGDLAPVVGVFEVYVDVNRLVRLSERAQEMIVPVILALFLLLFVVLVAIVWHAEVLINRQAGIIRERTRTLETLSAQLLSAQEDEKRRIATALHEDIGQSLGAAKMQVESFCLAAEKGKSNPEAMRGLVALFQGLIRETRSLAMRLRPLSLDEFGLVETLSGFIAEFEDLYPKVQVSVDLAVQEEEIPRPLKIVIYRVVQDALNNLISHTEADRLEVRLQHDADTLDLSICENSTIYFAHGATDEAAGTVSAAMKERALLSGGEFSMQSGSRGMTCWVASWVV